MKTLMLTGKPSIDRPWMKFYPDVLRGIQVPASAPWSSTFRARCRP
ncbi:MAG: hypothetical protein ACLR7K_09900 [Subdoligranulum sp.]